MASSEESFLICSASNPHSVGAGDQGPWNSCVIFATLSALAKVVKTDFNIDIDVQATAEALTMQNLQNRWGQSIITHGTDVHFLVEQISTQFKEGHLMMKTKDNQCFIIANELEAVDCLPDEPKSLQGYGYVLVGGAGAGQHMHHALTGKVYKGGGSFLCENSWGEQDREVELPGELWPEMKQCWNLTIMSLDILDTAGGRDTWFAGKVRVGEEIVMLKDNVVYNHEIAKGEVLTVFKCHRAAFSAKTSSGHEHFFGGLGEGVLWSRV